VRYLAEPGRIAGLHPAQVEERPLEETLLPAAWFEDCCRSNHRARGMIFDQTGAE
jgi:hypothetical protein